MKFLSILCIFLAFMLYVMVVWVDTLRNEVSSLESEKKALKNEIERYMKNDLEKDKRKKQANNLAESEKSAFDWHRNISDSAVINELRKTCKSCSKTN